MPEKAAHHQKSPLRQAAGRVNRLARDRAADDPRLIEARRALQTERIAAHARVVADAWPALDADQIARVTAILNGSVGS